ncbi:Uma2 family endonuclease [Myxacorys almedinensis]|uniref:Uma2 family endonuclease n=1 Tax=Myxacorys almedinensis A TaxID=2690445 RepID=A0A8J7YZM2_9CYAN|nr:Uma2 family endonuclease [Myxacorys almedinensis]NDJ17532.1 Uma2 family endonuclease [Myxacorys almedinensis A]
MVSVPNLDLLEEPYSNEPELEHSLHLAQIVLLLTCLEWWWQQRQDFFAAGNLSIYYQPPELQSKKFRGPDFFVVLGTERRPRGSWVVSRENGQYPNVIVEILSRKTAKTDRTTKRDLYQNLFQTPEYFWFNPDPQQLEFVGLRLQAGHYQDIPRTDQGWMWSEQLELYLGIANNQLRYFTAEGVMIPNFEEESAQSGEIIKALEQRLEREQRRVEQSESIVQQQGEELERLRRYLRSQGIDPDQLTQSYN